MKIAFLFLVFLVAASADFIAGTGTGIETKLEKIADKEFMVRNRNIVRLFRQINSLNANEDQRRIAKEFRFESNLDRFTKIEVVKEFLVRLRMGMLPRNKIFSVTNDRQRDEVVSLFHVLFFARDFDTFYRVACWARDYINEGMFVYAMTVAIFHRRDTRGMVLPAPYEIYPFYFINTEVIEKARRLKMQERVFDPKLADFFGVRQVENTFYIRGNYSGWYTPTNDENALTYFTEDIGLNTYYYYFHATYPFWFNTEEFGFARDRRGEFYIYTHQQLLARYYMERLSNNLGEIPRFMWDRPIRTGFRSSLRQFNGMEMPSRPNDFNLYTEDNLLDLTEVRDYERRIRDSIDRGFIITEGKTFSLRKPEDVERLGRMMRANRDDPDMRYYVLGTLAARRLLGNGDDVFNDYWLNPTVLETYETSLRDPMFYQLMQRFMYNFLRFKRNLRPYTRDEVSFDGVKIEDVRVDRLVTFFDTFDVDITNAVNRKGEEMDKNRDMFIFKARQERLNHLPFDVKMEFNSDKSTDAVIRIFLGPKFDSMRRRIRFNENRFNFFEMDRFVYKLKTGRNTVTRNSREFWTTVEDRFTVNDIFKRMDICITGTEQCMIDFRETQRGFPDRLLLPRGRRIGMEFYLYVVITPRRDTKFYGTRDTDRVNRIPITRDDRRDFFTTMNTIDDNAFGFPLDREIDRTAFWNSNMLLREVLIFHKAGMSDNMTDRDRERVDVDRTDRDRLDLDRTDRDRLDLDRTDRDRIDRTDRDRIERTDRDRIDRTDRDRMDRMDRERIDRMDRDRIDRTDRERIDRTDRDRIDRTDRDRTDRTDRDRIDRTDRDRTDRTDRDRIDRTDRDRTDRTDRDRIDRTDRDRTDRTDRDRIDRTDRDRTDRMDRDRIDRTDRDRTDRTDRDRIDRTDRDRTDRTDRDRVDRVDRDRTDRTDRDRMDRVDRDRTDRTDRDRMDRVERDRTDRTDRDRMDRVDRDRKDRL